MGFDKTVVRVAFSHLGYLTIAELPLIPIHQSDGGGLESLSHLAPPELCRDSAGGNGGRNCSMSRASSSDGTCSPRSIAEYRVVLIPARSAISCCRIPDVIRL